MTKEEKKQLFKDFTIEMDKREGSILDLGLLKVLKFIYWSAFREKRALYFVLRVIQGMHHKPAYDYANYIEYKAIDSVIDKILNHKNSLI